jgi:glycosyltransferase involved in cell wall biosynthesis
MKILVCSNFFPPEAIGGAELVAFEHGRVMRDRGHEVRVFRGRLGGAPWRPSRLSTRRGEFPQAIVGLSPRDIAGDTWNFANPLIENAFRDTVVDFAPDVVHFHNLVGLSVRLIDVCQSLGIPTVMTLHDYWAICFKNTMIKNDGRVCRQSGFDCLGCQETVMAGRVMPTPVRNAWILRSMARLDQLVVPSHYMTDRYVEAGLPRERIAVIKYGIDVNRFTPSLRENDVLTLGFIGYLGRHKGLAVLLEALPRVRPPEGVRLLVVGDGEQAGALKALCQDLGLDGRVTFLGRIDNQAIRPVYDQLDALVVPSVWPENSPVTISEAMACGLPVLASDIGGIRELVTDGVTGFLVPPGDSDALAQRVGRLLAEPALRDRMGQAAREWICACSVDRQVDQILDVYQRAIATRDGASEFPPGAPILYHSAATWGGRLRQAFGQLAEVERLLKRRVLPFDLAGGGAMLDTASVLLILSADARALPAAVRALSHGVPLIVPEELEELRELCVASGAGLFWREPDELGACVELLLSRDDVRAALGASGRRFVEARARTAPAG